MKLLVIRHGQSQANSSGVVAGSQIDSPLSEQGILDNMAVAEQLIGKKIDWIVSSPKTRAIDTAKQIQQLAFPNIEIQVNSDFSERNVGEASGMKLEDYYALEKSGAVIEGAEPPEEMFSRVERGLQELRSLAGNGLLVTHNGTYRMLKCVVDELPPEDFMRIQGLENGEIKELEI
ncbi:MAG: histidine phosphatase family protein [Patescibacteria group bacterium]